MRGSLEEGQASTQRCPGCPRTTPGAPMTRFAWGWLTGVASSWSTCTASGSQGRRSHEEEPDFV